MTGSGVMTIPFHKGLTRNPEIGFRKIEKLPPRLWLTNKNSTRDLSLIKQNYHKFSDIYFLNILSKPNQKTQQKFKVSP